MKPIRRWEVGTYRGVSTVFDSRGNRTIPIATVHDVTIDDPAEIAQLIAAAPDLLAACQLALWELRQIRVNGSNPLTDDGLTYNATECLEIAINKAEIREGTE